MNPIYECVVSESVKMMAVQRELEALRTAPHPLSAEQRARMQELFTAARTHEGNALLNGTKGTKTETWGIRDLYETEEALHNRKMGPAKTPEQIAFDRGYALGKEAVRALILGVIYS